MKQELVKEWMTRNIVTIAIRFGDPTQEILNLITEEKVDLVATAMAGPG